MEPSSSLDESRRVRTARDLDEAGRTWRLQNDRGYVVHYGYDAAGEMTGVSDGGYGGLVGFYYDDLGRRTAVTRAGGVTSWYGYDAVSRLASLRHDFAGTEADLEIILGYNPAGQVRTRTTTNAMYNWSEVDAVNRPYASDALNQTTSSGPQALAWSAAGTLASDGARGLVYGYDALNRLTSAGAPGSPSPATLAYDPVDWLRRTTGANGGAVTQFRSDGDEVPTEHARARTGDELS